jgi:hypothetical protein
MPQPRAVRDPKGCPHAAPVCVFVHPRDLVELLESLRVRKHAIVEGGVMAPAPGGPGVTVGQL